MTETTTVYIVERYDDEGHHHSFGEGFTDKGTADSVVEALTAASDDYDRETHSIWRASELVVTSYVGKYVPLLKRTIYINPFTKRYEPSSVVSGTAEPEGTPLPLTIKYPPTETYKFWHAEVYGRTLEEVGEKALRVAAQLSAL